MDLCMIMDKVGRRITQVVGDVGFMIDSNWSCCSLAIEYRQVGGNGVKPARPAVVI